MVIGKKKATTMSAVISSEVRNLERYSAFLIQNEISPYSRNDALQIIQQQLDFIHQHFSQFVFRFDCPTAICGVAITLLNENSFW